MISVGSKCISPHPCFDFVTGGAAVTEHCLRMRRQATSSEHGRGVSDGVSNRRLLIIRRRLLIIRHLLCAGGAARRRHCLSPRTQLQFSFVRGSWPAPSRISRQYTCRLRAPAFRYPPLSHWMHLDRARRLHLRPGRRGAQRLLPLGLRKKLPSIRWVLRGALH